VLVIERSREIRLLMKILLIRRGFQVRLAGSGAEGVERIESEPFSAIVVGSPVPLATSSGDVSLLDHLAQHHPELGRRTIIVTTQVADRRMLRRAEKLNIYAVLAKPFENEEFVETVCRCADSEPAVNRPFGMRSTALPSDD
jgi:two-component system, NtrC family, response regulator AtoC